MSVTYEITDFDQACEFIFTIAPDLERVMNQVNHALDNPSECSGPQAAMAAMKISAIRFKLGLQAQHWKIKSAQTKKLGDRLVKDALMVAFDGLLEVINTLKLLARQEHDILRGN